MSKGVLPEPSTLSTTMRYDRGRGSLDRHPTYIVAPSSLVPAVDTQNPPDINTALGSDDWRCRMLASASVQRSGSSRLIMKVKEVVVIDGGNMGDAAARVRRLRESIAAGIDVATIERAAGPTVA